MILKFSSQKQYILETYDQVAIFATYLEIDEKEIDYCLEDKNNKISNPLREDKDPSLGFRIVLDKQTDLVKIKMYDFANAYYRGDCFDLVGIIRHLNPSRGDYFIAICKDIEITMKNRTLHHSTKNLVVSDKESFIPIHIEPRLWNKFDIDLWSKWGLPFNEIKHLIFPLQNSFLSNYCNYRYDEKDPGYAWKIGYYDEYTLYTLYFPFRNGKDKTKPRFIKNNKFYELEAIHELKPANILVITKAYKEKLLIRRLLSRLEYEENHTIEVSNFRSESTILSTDFVLKLFDIFPIIVTNTDFDRTGLYTSGEHKRRYGMIRFIPTNGKYGTYDFGGKDLCDIHAHHGEQYCIDILQACYNYILTQI